MEKISVNCALHPKETIARVDIELGAEKELYCVECLLNMTNPGRIGASLKPLSEFIEIAAKFYGQNRTSATGGSEAPSEYTDILSQKDEKIERVSVQIEEQKKRVQVTFEELREFINNIISKKCLE
jgi:hypothetical protein